MSDGVDVIDFGGCNRWSGYVKLWSADMFEQEMGFPGL